MTDLFTSKPKQTAQDIARRIAKTAKDEIVEYGKSASQQVLGQEGGISPITEAIRQGTQHVPDAEHEGIHADERRKLNYLERELEELRQRRKMQDEQNKMYEMQSREEKKPVLILQEPSGKRGRRMMGGREQARKKQTKIETGKQVSG